MSLEFETHFSSKTDWFEDFSKTGIAIEKLRDEIRVQSMRHILVVKLLGLGISIFFKN